MMLIYKPQVTLPVIRNVVVTILKHANLQSSGLEQVLVVLLPGLFCLLSGQICARLSEAAVLVNKSKLLDNVVVESMYPLLISKSMF